MILLGMAAIGGASVLLGFVISRYSDKDLVIYGVVVALGMLLVCFVLLLTMLLEGS